MLLFDAALPDLFMNTQKAAPSNSTTQHHKSDVERFGINEQL